MECEPTARLAVENVAIPPAPMLPVPSVAAPSMKVTRPVGKPAPEVTLAEKVTDWPKTVGFDEAANVVVVVAWLTTCGAAESSPELFNQPFVPVNVAVTECVPTARL